MKRIAASMGLVALGTSALHAVDSTALSAMQTTKPWSVSASLRGFYDDNINTTDSNEEDSVGFEISPSVSVGIAGERTAANASYTYSGKWYETRPGDSSDHWDHTHMVDLGLTHGFTPRLQLAVSDSFVVGQEPDVIRLSGQPLATFQRVSGNNYRNFASIALNADVTRLLGFEVGYDNAWFDYDDEDPGMTPGGLVVSPSLSGLLDRMEHRAHIDSRWYFRPQTVGIVGYQFGQTEYQGDEPIQGSGIPVFDPYVESDVRNNRSHYIYGGLEHSFTPDLSGVVRIGAQYIDFYNDPDDEQDWSPYVQASLRYMYAAEGAAELGVTHSRTASDLIGPTSGDFVRDVSATTVYGSVTHRILPQLYGTLIGLFQHQSFNGGGPMFDDETDRFYQIGLDLSYRFNPHFSAHVGYNHDRADSDIPGREFTRNRVYAGVTATY